MPTIGLNGHHAVQIYEKNLPLDFNGHSQRLWLRARRQFQERLRWSHCMFFRIACYGEGVARMLRGEDPQVSVQPLAAGTLNVFAGRNTAHRVAPVLGKKSRLVAVFSYYDNPGVTFSSNERIGFYGRPQ